ncbi:ABC transporter substrate-binding protein [Sinosporangium siamense]|uniref:Solute-binding protein family 3/N-terminal domain-containing protein n=1 Tax=Sinosporangium siamense TaxID=1367973 RepID=A0A919V886_9ACTN|nr:ABC transporter substrate-binding protein [Sinosporangium siamense]GII92942.1 hypothetical protein Ssi02_31730 [Sinosporangium siamense]
MWKWKRNRTRVAAPVMSIAMALAIAGCGTQDQAKPAKADAKAPYFHLLPEKIAKAGSVVVATNATYPPIEYMSEDNKTIIGFDPDLGAALGKQLGVEMKFVNVTEFDAIIPGLVAGRYDIAMAFISDLKERYDKVHFIDYFEDRAVLMVSAKNPAGIASFSDLCGRTVVVQKGAVTESRTAEAPNAECAAAGKAPVNIVQLPAATDKQTQLKSGRADAAITNVPNASYLVKNAPADFKIVGEPIEAPGSHIGIAVPAQDTKLRDAIKAALQSLIDSGEYKTLLERYDLEDGAVPAAVINGDG